MFIRPVKASTEAEEWNNTRVTIKHELTRIIKKTSR